MIRRVIHMIHDPPCDSYETCQESKGWGLQQVVKRNNFCLCVVDEIYIYTMHMFMIVYVCVHYISLFILFTIFTDALASIGCAQAPILNLQAWSQVLYAQKDSVASFRSPTCHFGMLGICCDHRDGAWLLWAFFVPIGVRVKFIDHPPKMVVFEGVHFCGAIGAWVAWPIAWTQYDPVFGTLVPLPLFSKMARRRAWHGACPGQSRVGPDGKGAISKWRSPNRYIVRMRWGGSTN